MPMYECEHMRGVAGVDERDVERQVVAAADAAAALRQVTDWPITPMGGTSKVAEARNPDATHGGSGAYNDYWYAEPGEDAAIG